VLSYFEEIEEPSDKSHSLKELLAEMPGVGEDEDFARSPERGLPLARTAMQFPGDGQGAAPATSSSKPVGFGR
jgi:hypothetical protein